MILEKGDTLVPFLVQFFRHCFRACGWHVLLLLCDGSLALLRNGVSSFSTCRFLATVLFYFRARVLFRSRFCATDFLSLIAEQSAKW
jgi:hypothetical protein